jgi:hypothetical protein
MSNPAIKKPEPQKDPPSRLPAEKDPPSKEPAREAPTSVETRREGRMKLGS